MRILRGLALLALLVPATAAAKEPAFTCTQIMGVSVTGDWYGAGFETLVPDARFQALWRKHAFIEKWADPKNDLWAEKLTSPCTARAQNPDRIVFTGVNWNFKTADEWVLGFTKVVEVLAAKYKGVKRIELMTMLRGPGNNQCGDPRSAVAPAIDEAITRVVAAFPKLVHAAPKVEAPSCDVFHKGGPHYTPEGMKAVAAAYGKAFSAQN